jgi:hypothetical protein
VSALISLASGLFGAIPQRDDYRGVSEVDWQWSCAAQPAPLLPIALADDGVSTPSFATCFWPGGASLDGGVESVRPGAWWSAPWTTSGANGRLGFVGYTRDAFGSPLGGCTVRCVRTSTNELVAQVTSDANGFYTATTPYGDAHYLTVHNSAVTPAVAGASVDSLIPG